MLLPLLAVVPLVMALVVAVAGGAGTLSAGGDGGGPVGAAGATTDPPTTTDPGPAATAPRGPGADPELAAAADVTLPFDEAGPLPDIGEDRPWEQAVGSWSVVDQRIVGVSEAVDDGALATFDPGPGELRVEVALPDAHDLTGLAFSITDGSYLLWAPARDFPTIALYRVEGDEVDFVLHSQRSDLGPGMRIGLHLLDDRVELLAGGAVVATYDDVDPTTPVGLAVAPGGAFGTFDDLAVDLPAGA